MNAVDAGIWGCPEIPDKTTLGVFLDGWISSRWEEWKPSTARSYLSIMRRAMAELGDVPLEQVGPHDIQRFLDGLQVSPKTKKNYRLFLSSAFSAACSLGLIDENPVLDTRPPRTHRRPLHILSPGEARSLLEAFPDPHDRQLVEFAMLTGLRRGEIFALQWRDLQDGSVHVERTLSGGREALPKGRKRRRVPLPEHLWVELEARRGEPNERVFPGNPDTWVKRRFSPAVRQAGLDGLRFHDLRHFFASSAIRAGVDILRLQTWLGHSSAQVTLDIYGHLFPADEASLIERLANGLHQNHTSDPGK